MNRLEAWILHISSLLVGATGLVYAWMVYLVKPADPYAVVNHPLQPALQHLHILVAPLLVFAAGLVWHRHAWSQWRKGVGHRRRSGVSLIFTLLPMVASGYLIQTAVETGWRRIWVIVHLATSALWLVGYLSHQVPVIWALLHRRRPRLAEMKPGEEEEPPRRWRSISS
jgi:hypothetical protein